MSTWPLVPVSDVCELIVDCVNRTARLSAEPTRYKMIRTTNVRNGFIDTENVRCVDEATFKRWTRRAVPLPGDVVLTREAPLGEVGIIRYPDRVFLGQRTIMYRAAADKLDPYFLLYSMLGENMQGQIRGYGSGSTVEHMRLPDCFRLLVALPPLPTQRKIASILSGYDDVIENNNRRIKVLEEMAQRIYREWFVDFRYPGHAGAQPIESELGNIPDGWEVRRLGEVVELRTKTISPGAFPDESFQHFSIPAFDKDGLAPVEVGATILSNKFLVDGRCVLYAKLNPRIPRVWWVEPLENVRGVASTEFLVLQSVYPWNLALLHEALRNRDFVDQVIGMAGGTSTSHQRVKPRDMLALRVVCPPAALCEEYRRIAEPLLRLRDRLGRELALAGRIRDLLLPRLISGEIDVDDLDINVGDQAA